MPTAAGSLAGRPDAVGAAARATGLGSVWPLGRGAVRATPDGTTGADKAVADKAVADKAVADGLTSARAKTATSNRVGRPA